MNEYNPEATEPTPNTTQIKAEIERAQKTLTDAKAQSGDQGSWQQSYMTLLYAVDIVIANLALARAAALLEPEPIIAMPAGTLYKILDMAGTATYQEPPEMTYTVSPEVAAWLRGILSASGTIDGQQKSWAIHELKPRKETK